MNGAEPMFVGISKITLNPLKVLRLYLTISLLKVNYHRLKTVASSIKAAEFIRLCSLKPNLPPSGGSSLVSVALLLLWINNELLWISAVKQIYLLQNILMKI